MPCMVSFRFCGIIREALRELKVLDNFHTIVCKRKILGFFSKGSLVIAVLNM